MMPTIDDAVRRFREIYTTKLSDCYLNDDLHLAEFLSDNCNHEPDGIGFNCYVEISVHDNNTGAPCLIEWFDPTHPHN